MGNGFKAAGQCVFACTVIPEKIKYENKQTSKQFTCGWSLPNATFVCMHTFVATPPS